MVNGLLIALPTSAAKSFPPHSVPRCGEKGARCRRTRDRRARCRRTRGGRRTPITIKATHRRPT